MSNPISISVVTACYNMATSVKRTIESIVRQNYSNLQYVVVDGGSTDGTVDILHEYDKRINILISESDDGQYHAIQKGMALAHGEVLAWLNADDIYYPWTFSVVAEVFEKFQDVDWIIGLPSHINASGQCIFMANGSSAYPREFIMNGWARGRYGPHLQQESMFWRRSLWERVGGLNLNWKYAADFELWTRFAQFGAPVPITFPLAGFCSRPGQRSASDKYHREVLEICQSLPSPPALWRLFAGKSRSLACLCRLAIWKSSQVISYSREQQEWIKLRLRRPLSRSSLQQLILERALVKNCRTLL